MPNRFVRSLLLIPMLALAGCASGGRHHDAPVPPSAQDILSRALADIRAVQPVDCQITFQAPDDSIPSMWSEYDLNGSPGVPGPGCTGLIRASSWMMSHPYEQIRALLAHEIGHLLDGDDGQVRLAQQKSGALTKVALERDADQTGATILRRISPDACMALPAIVGQFPPDDFHPLPADRVAATTAVCQSSPAMSVWLWRAM